jgi:hypothetical protein
MCLSLTSPPNRILACLDVRTTLSKKFNERCRASTGRPLILRIGAHARHRRCADPRRTVTRKPDVRVDSLRRIYGDRRSACGDRGRQGNDQGTAGERRGATAGDGRNEHGVRLDAAIARDGRVNLKRSTLIFS